MMRYLFLLFAFACSISAYSQSQTVIEQAIHQLPSKCLADLPPAERQLFIDEMLNLEPNNKCLDIKNQFLEFYADGETPFHMSSMLYMKVFPDKSGDIVLCHMPKPHADNKPARLSQTFFFRLRDGHFIDITKKILPKEINLKWRFQPRRSEPAIEVGPYEKTKRNDGRGYAFIAHHPIFSLMWNGSSFEATKLKSDNYSYDSL